jgi:hypothetical protein
MFFDIAVLYVVFHSPKSQVGVDRAIVELDPVIHLKGPAGTRSMPLNDLHRLPGDRPEVETELQPDICE